MPEANTATKTDTEDQVPDYDVIEEGSPEAKAMAGGGRVEDESGEDDQDDAQDERIGRHASQGRDDADQATDRTSASKSRRQRQRMKDKLEAKDALITSLQQQNRNFAVRLDTIEKRTGSNEVAMLDKAIVDTQQLMAEAEQAHAVSLTQNDPLQVTAAMKNLFAAQQRLDHLNGVKQNVGRQSTQPKPTDTNVARNVNAFMARNPWFRPETNDADSRIAKVLDDQIADEGFDPATPAYWQELDRRIKRRLPHRAPGGGSNKGKRNVEQEEIDDEDEDFVDEKVQNRQRRDKDDEDERPARSHVSGSGSNATGGSRVKVTLSRERIQALKDANKWDDPTERNKMIREYVKYDRENANQRG